MKKLFEKIWKNKIWTAAIIAVLTIISVIYYGVSYYNQNGLEFTKEDGLILGIQAAIFIILSLLVIWLIIDRQKIYKIIYKIYNQIIESENDNVLLHRDTQDLIIRLFKKGENRDVTIDEKK